MNNLAADLKDDCSMRDHGAPAFRASCLVLFGRRLESADPLGLRVRTLQGGGLPPPTPSLVLFGRILGDDRNL